MIEIKGLTKYYGDLLAVDHLDLTVRPGELFGFLGPNGAGKTTTIRMMVGLLRPTEGKVYINGHDVEREPLAAKACIGYLPEIPFLYEKLTGREFLSFVAELYGVEPERARRRGDDLLRLFDLEEQADELIQGYSHGMRQKIALAGALIHEPKVLILDEPTRGLDPRSARTVKDILRRLCAQGATVFMSTHILEIAERMCDRVGIIDRGRLIACGTMEELRAQSQSPGSTLEDIFLQLTGGVEYEEIIKFLSE